MPCILALVGRENSFVTFTVPLGAAGAALEAIVLERRFRIVTPCFAGGVESELAVRLPAILGMLRTWWRTTQFDHFALGAGSLPAMRTAEFALFGAAADEKNIGQGRFLATLSGPGPSQRSTYRLDGRLRSLAGRAAGNRPSFLTVDTDDGADDLRFRIGFRFKRTAFPGHYASLQRALDLWLALGSLGLCSRRGFGSCNVVSGEIPPTVSEYRTLLYSHLPAQRPTAPPQTFPLLSRSSQIWFRRVSTGTSGDCPDCSLVWD